MSLVCHECDQDLVPSRSFPGREGGVVHPSVLAVAWVGDADVAGQVSWTPVFVEASDNVSICFACVLKKASRQAKIRMREVFRVYAVEIEYQRLERDQKGEWVPMSEASRTSNLYQQFIEKLNTIRRAACLCCDSLIPAQERAFFTFKVINKARCELGLSAFGSYQWSNLEAGETSFLMCFSCVRTNLPRTFKTLGNALRGVDSRGGQKEGRVDLFLSPEIMKDMFGFTPN